MIKDHVLLAGGGDILEADADLSARLTKDVVGDVLRAVPDDLLKAEAIKADFRTPDAARARYAEYLSVRARAPRAFVDEIITARARADRTPARRVHSRR